MDDSHPAEGLRHFEEWTLDLRNLQMATYNGEEVAVKIIERPNDDPEKEQLMENQFAHEVTTLATLRHPNIVRLIGACRKLLVWCIVTEYAKGGSLREFLRMRHNRTPPLKVVVRQGLDIVRGMAYLHSMGFIHRDLKSDNLLIAAEKVIKIADFGVARIEVQTGMTPEIGTYRWMAPEDPFENMSAVQAAFAVVNRGERPIMPRDCLPSLVRIINQCWDTNPDTRPHFSVVVQMLEEAQNENFKNARRALFRCCNIQPSTSG
ncbi:hypothetical protein AMTRI_Chr12g233810 [Amborella trichopoda]